MTPEELVAQLAPVRVPEAFARFGLQDTFAAVALGIVAGIVFAALLRRVTVRRIPPHEALRAELMWLATLAPEVRLNGLAAMLRARGGTRPDGLDAALYDPHASLAPEPLEQAVLNAEKGQR